VLTTPSMIEAIIDQMIRDEARRAF